MKVGIVIKPGISQEREIIEGYLPWLAQRASDIHIAEGSMPLPRKYKRCKYKDLPSVAEIVIVLGGDGTMLRTARELAGHEVPLVGVNLGGMGFITEVSRDEFYESVGRILKGRYRKEKRMMLNAVVHRKGGMRQFTALNDIVVSRGILDRVIDLETSIDGNFVNVFKADGLIAATPTGSTAYSLSAGGPIIYPTEKAIVITPICPHTLTNRPIVLSSESKIDISLASESEGVHVSHDGQPGCDLHKGDKVTITRSPHCTVLLVPKERNYYQVLRGKLKWGER